MCRVCSEGDNRLFLTDFCSFGGVMGFRGFNGLTSTGMMLKIRQMTFIRRGASEDYIPSSLSK
jgi:hypothetical protein